jgi:hypothetical protein
VTPHKRIRDLCTVIVKKQFNLGLPNLNSYNEPMVCLSHSCLIARNLLGGMKTCKDVFQYMNYIENNSASGALSGVDSLVKGYIKVGCTVTLIC